MSPKAQVEPEVDAVKPWVTMGHPALETTGISTREAYERLWAPKGWTIVDEHVAAPDLAGTEILPERLVDAHGNVTDTPADPARLTKVLAGEVKPEDVGVDPAVLEDAPAPAPDVEPAPPDVVEQPGDADPTPEG